jgi:hypothetical protein
MAEKIVCPVCGRDDFKNTQGLSGHMRQKHPDWESGGEIAPVSERRVSSRREAAKEQALDEAIEKLRVPTVPEEFNGAANIYWAGFNEGVSYGANSVLAGIRLAQALSSLGISQATPVIEMAKEMRQAEAQAAQVVAERLAQITGESNREILAALQNLNVSAQAASPNPVQRMLGMMQAIPQMLIAAQNLMGMFGMRVQPGQPQQVPQDQLQAQQPSFGAAGPQPATQKDIEEAFGDQPAATV